MAFFATAPRGVEPLLAEELRALGAAEVTEAQAGVSFEGSLPVAYRACLWSRVASRILLSLGKFPAPDPDALYKGISDLPWEDHVTPDGTLAVDFTTSRSAITHSHYGALKVKDAVVDRFRDRYGVRPSVDVARPNIRINVYLLKDEARVSLDLSGDSLHRRGYREEGSAAPLKENLAAALLLRARWPDTARSGGPLLDPMCGSGTLPIEAACIAADIAPGLARSYFGFLGWKGFDPQVWEALLEEARKRKEKGLAGLPTIVGYDLDPAAVTASIANVNRAGLRGRIHIEKRDIALVEPIGGRDGTPGLMIVNPPYGVRMGDKAELGKLYEQLGDTLRERFPGWMAGVFMGNPEFGAAIRLRPRRSYDLFNGPIACKLLTFKLASGSRAPDPARHAPAPASRASDASRASGVSDIRKPRPDRREQTGPSTPAPRSTGQVPSSLSHPPSASAEMLANRLRKTLRHIGRWARRSDISCFRLYDADLPEYGFTADIYQGEETWAHVKIHEPPGSADPDRVDARRQEAMSALPEVLGIPLENVYVKERRRQRGADQYEQLGAGGKMHEVSEAGGRFLVNFTDYFDTGLFLDHRRTREIIKDRSRGRRFLNLFGYTGTASVLAGLGGAVATTTVDMSKAYLDWAGRNFALNGLDTDNHVRIRADCLEWLDAEMARGEARQRYDLIFLDPPTFSNSKGMQDSFDVQQDHIELIASATQLLEPDGVLLFSTNRRGFKMEYAAGQGFTTTDLSRVTLCKDFERNPRNHHCWEIVRDGS